MKRLVLLLTLLAFPALAGTYSITTNASQDAKLDKARLRHNRTICQYYGLPGTCTQTQAREQFCRRANFGGVTTCVPDPASTPENPLPQICTTSPLVSDCAGATQVDVYTTVQKFLDGEIVRLIRDEYGPKNDQADKASAREAWPTLTQAQRDAVCSSLGLAAGCDPW